MPNRQPFNPGDVIPEQMMQAVAVAAMGGIAAIIQVIRQRIAKVQDQQLGAADRFAIDAAKGRLGGPLVGRRPGQPNQKPFRHPKGL